MAQGAKAMNIGILLASGTGQRYHSDVPKQWVKINGKTAALYALEEMLKSQIFDEIAVIVNDLKYEYIFEKYNVYVIQGGDNRNISVARAIEFAVNHEATHIMFHDAVRPLIKAKDFAYYFNLLDSDKLDGIITCAKITDTLYPVLNRDQYKLISTPEVFKMDALEKYFNVNRLDYTAIYQHLPLDRVGLLLRTEPNFKLTYPTDLPVLENILKFSPYIARTPDLKNKQVLLLGASGGIGQAVYQQIKALGAEHIYAPSSKEFSLGNDAINSVIPLCYSDVDIIINAAGLAFLDTENILDNYESTMACNIKGNLQLIQMVRRIRETNHTQQINMVFISSSSATRGREGMTVYSASKAAVHSIVESQARLLAKQEIYLNCICPEKTDTPLLRRTKPNFKADETLLADEVSRAILSYCVVQEGGHIVHIRKGMQL